MLQSYCILFNHTGSGVNTASTIKYVATSDIKTTMAKKVEISTFLKISIYSSFFSVKEAIWLIMISLKQK